jgi:CheY-like chemotaxis protein
MRAMRGDEHAARGKVKNFETIFTAKGGEQIPVAISGSIIYDEHGQELGSIGFAKDLREIRRRDRLMTLGEVAVSLAHEINNPLEVLTNTAELLELFVRKVASDEQMVIETERFEAIQRELHKIQDIVSRVQAMAAGDAYGTRQYLPGTLMTDLRPGADAAAPAAPDNGTPAAPLAGWRILVVDDDLGVCQSLAELLRSQGCAVVVAGSASEALGKIAGARFDLVLSDVVMPDMDGYDLYMELKERRPDLPVVLMTGYLYDRDHVIKRSKLAGLDSGVLFKKPIDPERLMTIIRTHGAPGAAGVRQDRRPA